MKLDTHSRDNFYVKARISHRSRFRPELSFNIGDVFHVTDTKPTGTARELYKSLYWNQSIFKSHSHPLILVKAVFLIKYIIVLKMI